MWLPWILLCLAVTVSAERPHQNEDQYSDTIMFPTTLNLRTPSQESPQETENLKEKFRNSVQTVFGVTFRLKELLNDSSAQGQNTNFLMSPVSLVAALAQLTLASRGETRRGLLELMSPINSTNAMEHATMLQFHKQLGELLRLLQKGSDAALADSYELYMSGALFYDQNFSLLPAFQYSVSDIYGLNILSMNFRDDPVGAQKAVNDWVANHTHNLFTSIIKDPLAQTTIALLTNTVYFKGAWEIPFDPDLTVTRMFRQNSTHQVEASFMRAHFEQLSYVENERLACRLIILPYKHRKAAMYIILPTADVGDYDIRDFASRLTFTDVEELVSSTKPDTVTVWMPKVKLSHSFSIRNSILQRQVEMMRMEETSETTPLPPKKVYRPYQTTTNGQIYHICRGLDCNDDSTAGNQQTSQDTELNSISDVNANISQQIENKITSTDVPSTPSPPTVTQATKDSRVVFPRLDFPAPSKENSTKIKTHPPCRHLETRKNSLDLSGASTYPNFNINDILHHVFLEVNEVGTEAAAVTISLVDYSGDVRNFKVDKPFLFFIMHEATRAPLFWGIVADPTAGSQT